ncbi:putative RNA-binding Zn ribbon-like protein [Actinocorallia herbida]|uniref:Putative RNA-binding Zn ribbon-like protein n=1 Tax=Actinocorallia herbida TaxID=58109 RepID=A0A3N1D1J4_9ACTN|nr:CGNR zinc finger domain-containing protein [Actinocorallia herbida]ROO87394.1 putative RNA-binding Zn ribbon-like protein [Actinocorallia herbida]
MQFNTYTAAGAHIAADLVNQPSPHAAWLTDLLSGHDVHQATADDAMVEDLRQWTLRLRPVFETTSAQQATLVDALLIAADCHPRLVSHDGLAHHLHYAPLHAPLPARVKALTAAGLAHLIADGAGGRLGRCGRSGCPLVFLDTSRNGRRHFCSVRCANAVNVSRYRTRHRQSG